MGKSKWERAAMRAAVLRPLGLACSLGTAPAKLTFTQQRKLKRGKK